MRKGVGEGGARGKARGQGNALGNSKVWLTAQKTAFDLAIYGAPLEQALDILLRTAVEQTGGSARCAFWLADENGAGLYHLGGMPEEYVRHVNGFPIGHDSLACGLAVATAEPVITFDVRQEPRWRDLLWLAEENGFRAIWSFPLTGTAAKPLGTFAMYFAEPRRPTAEDLELAGIMVQAATIIIAYEFATRGRARLERQRQTLLHELQHRSGSIMGMVSALAERSIRAAADVNEFRKTFRRRLNALERSQRLVSRLHKGQPVALDEVIRIELGVYAPPDGGSGRVTLSGPQGVPLRARMVQILTMALHELAANAADHGALHEPDGRLQVGWQVTDADKVVQLEIEWRESGVRSAEGMKAHADGSEGRKLIESGLAFELDAQTKYELTPDGLHCRISLPLAESDDEAEA